MKSSALAALALAGVALSGCATVVNGTTQSISVSTANVSGAQCALTNSEGTWYVSTPGSVVVHKTKTDIQATCKKDGYQDASTTIASKFGAMTVGNVIAGGVIGIVVDAASGANYSYPQATDIPMAAVGAAAPPPATFMDEAPKAMASTSGAETPPAKN
ncbi:MAG TPA: hypothetical protein VGF56_06630 [Rhizomicrobium sp.]|jgi:hypothetical protein